MILVFLSILLGHIDATAGHLSVQRALFCRASLCVSLRALQSVPFSRATCERKEMPVFPRRSFCASQARRAKDRGTGQRQRGWTRGGHEGRFVVGWARLVAVPLLPSPVARPRGLSTRKFEMSTAQQHRTGQDRTEQTHSRQRTRTRTCTSLSACSKISLSPHGSLCQRRFGGCRH
jgi:hypothetical protein